MPDSDMANSKGFYITLSFLYKNKLYKNIEIRIWPKNKNNNKKNGRTR